MIRLAVSALVLVVLLVVFVLVASFAVRSEWHAALVFVASLAGLAWLRAARLRGTTAHGPVPP